MYKLLTSFVLLSLSSSIQIDTVGESCVNLQVRERKKWKKYPCAVKAGHFVQYRDPKVSQVRLLVYIYVPL